MNKVDRIRKKIETLLNKWKYGSSTEAKYRYEVYKELLEELDTLQRDTASEDLKDAAKCQENFYIIPQNVWKPSNEQMTALKAINLTGGISYIGQGQELINLYNDLKKLKDEVMKGE